jgi:(2Fe-2S) ferredoxin
MSRKPRVYVCVNLRDASDASCGARGSLALADALERIAGDTVEIRRSKCLGFCAYGPNIRRDGTGIHVMVDEADLPGIVDGSKPSNLADLEAQPEEGDAG